MLLSRADSFAADGGQAANPAVRTYFYSRFRLAMTEPGLVPSFRNKMRMDQANLPGSPSRRFGRGFVPLLLAVAWAVGLGVYAYVSRHGGERHTSLPSVGDEDSGKNGPSIVYQNTRPEVKYVGDATCAECHPKEAESYRRHPMGRSL